MILEIALVVVLISLAWFWQDSIGKREIAIAFCRQLASRYQLQLLDETVACHKIKLARDARGRAQLLRFYEFELSADGLSRLPCTLHLRGSEPLDWHIPPYAQAIH